MIKSLTANLFLMVSFIFVSPVAFTHVQHVYAQESSPKISDEAARGFSLYQSGDIRGAVNVLRERVKVKADDADAWHYLGLALMKSGDLKSAIQSFQTAVKLRPNFIAARTGLSYSLLLSNKNEGAKREAERILKQNKQSDEAHYIISDVSLKQGDYRKALEEADAALEIQPKFKAALDVKRKALFVVFMSAAYPFLNEDQEGGRKAAMALQIMSGYCCLDINQWNLQVGDARQAQKLAGAAEIYEKSIKRTPNLPETSEWRNDLESLIFWRDYFDPEKRAGRAKVLDAKSVTTNARILSKPDPQFTKEDVKGLEQAKVILRAVITESGEVKHIMVVKSLGYELTRRSMEAARKIRFEPAKKDGASVSVITLIDYDFKEMAAAAK